MVGHRYRQGGNLFPAAAGVLPVGAGAARRPTPSLAVSSTVEVPVSAPLLTSPAGRLGLLQEVGGRARCHVGHHCIPLRG